MFICICNAVTDRSIQKEIDNGARSRKEIATALNAGTCCGKCVNSIDRMISKSCEDESIGAGKLGCATIYRPA